MRVHTNHVHLHADLHEDVGIEEQNPPCLVTTTLRSMHDGFLLGDMQYSLTHCLPIPETLSALKKKKKKEHLKYFRDCMGVFCLHEAQ